VTLLHFRKRKKKSPAKRIRMNLLCKIIPVVVLATSSGGRGAALAMSTSTNVVSNRMQLSPSLRDSLPDLYSSALRPVKFQIGAVAEASESITLQQVATKHSGSVGSIAFVVRRPG